MSDGRTETRLEEVKASEGEAGGKTARDAIRNALWLAGQKEKALDVKGFKSLVYKCPSCGSVAAVPDNRKPEDRKHGTHISEKCAKCSQPLRVWDVFVNLSTDND